MSAAADKANPRGRRQIRPVARRSARGTTTAPRPDGTRHGATAGAMRCAGWGGGVGTPAKRPRQPPTRRSLTVGVIPPIPQASKLKG